MRVSLFGDDRDNLLARWNLLQASWGVGKAFYAQNQAPLSLNNENPLCRFKAIGYSAITSGSSDPELLSLIVKKKPAEVEAVKQNLTNDLQSFLLLICSPNNLLSIIYTNISKCNYPCNFSCRPDPGILVGFGSWHFF